MLVCGQGEEDATHFGYPKSGARLSLIRLYRESHSWSLHDKMWEKSTIFLFGQPVSGQNGKGEAEIPQPPDAKRCWGCQFLWPQIKVLISSRAQRMEWQRLLLPPSLLLSLISPFLVSGKCETSCFRYLHCSMIGFDLIIFLKTEGMLVLAQVFLCQ